MLPGLSSITVGRVLAGRLRHRWSDKDYHISPLPLSYPLPLSAPKARSIPSSPEVEPLDLTGDLRARLRMLRLSNGHDYLMSWFYRGGWHQPCPHLSCKISYFLPQPTLSRWALRLAPSRFRALRRFLACCATYGYWPCLSPILPAPTLMAGTDQSHGGPLPHHQA